MQTIVSLWLFVFCLNLGVYFIGNALEIDAVANQALNPSDILENQTEQIENLNSTTGGFSDNLIFGDYVQAINIFLNLFTGGALVEFMQLLCVDCVNLTAFTLPLQGILTFLNVIGIITLLRGIQII